MFRIFFYILIVAAISYGLAQLADVDGAVTVEWSGNIIELKILESIFVLFIAVFILMLMWSLFSFLLNSPATLSSYFQRKKQKKGLDALSGGLIAIGSGDRSMAQRMAGQARKTLPNDPMTQMLRAQAAELKGDIRQATHIYESMLAAPDTEIMGLRGLYLLALEQQEFVAAEQYAARALKRRQDLPWAVLGLYDLQCKRSNWQGAIETLSIAQDHRHMDTKLAKRQRAVLLTALAGELEETDTEDALKFAMEAHRLSPKLVPAAVIAGRIHASQGNLQQAIKVVRKCWKLAPHPDLAVVSAYARPGDSVRDRLDRISSLAHLTPGHKEASLAVAVAAVEAKDWPKARLALEPLVRGRPTQQVCTLMARIEGEETGHKGLVREWLSRAVHAPSDPHWVADGVVYDEWAAVSPTSGRVDAFEWKVPDSKEQMDDETITLKQMVAGLLTAETLEKAEPVEDLDDITHAVVDEDVDEIVDAEVIEAETVVDIDDTIDEADEELQDRSAEAAIEETQGQKKEEKSNHIEKDSLAAKDSDGDTSSHISDQEDGAVPAKKRKRRRKRAKIYVAPPAPDDPGTDELDDADLTPGMRPHRY